MIILKKDKKKYEEQKSKIANDLEVKLKNNEITISEEIKEAFDEGLEFMYNPINHREINMKNLEWWDDSPMFKSKKELVIAMYEQIKSSLTGDEQILIEIDLAQMED